jgi:hypothetical protein
MDGCRRTFSSPATPDGFGANSNAWFHIHAVGRRHCTRGIRTINWTSAFDVRAWPDHPQRRLGLSDARSQHRASFSSIDSSTRFRAPVWGAALVVSSIDAAGACLAAGRSGHRHVSDRSWKGSISWHPDRRNHPIAPPRRGARNVPQGLPKCLLLHFRHASKS